MSFDSLYSSVILLFPFDGTDGDITTPDVTGHVTLEPFDGCEISSAQSKWGGTSLYCNGTGAGAYVNDFGVPALRMDGAVDFCIEAWVYLPTGSSGGTVVMCATDNYHTENWALEITSAMEVRLGWGNTYNPTEHSLISSNTIPLDEWAFVKVSITGTTAGCWIDGSSGGTTSVNSEDRVSNNADFLFVGIDAWYETPFNGYIDDLRVTKGHSRTDTDTIVPTEAFPLSAPTEIIGSVTTTVVPESTLNKWHQNEITGSILTSITAASTMHQFSMSAHAIIGAVQTLITPSSTLAARRTRPSVIGLCPVNVTAIADIKRRVTRVMSGFIASRLIPSANMLKPVIVPANWVRRQYQCILTGSPDLILPVSSFTANLTVSGGSYLSVVVNGGADLISAIMDRQTGQLIISRVHSYSDGSIIAREFIRVNFDTFTSDTGPMAGTTITLNGRKNIKALSSKSVQIIGSMSRSLSAGVRHHRCPVNDELSLGDTAIINGEQLIAGKINYSVNAKSEFMEFSEYKADGSDLFAAIGSNARAKALSEYIVTTTNSNYTLWMDDAFYYSGVTANDQTIGQPFTLYSDSSGLLWFIAGFEGSANVKVFKADGITQASINI